MRGARAGDAVALEESFVGADARIALSVRRNLAGARRRVLVAAANAPEGFPCPEYAPRRGEAGHLRLRPRREARVSANGEDDPRPRRGTDPEPRCRRARRRDLPPRSPRRLLETEAHRVRTVGGDEARMIARLRGKPVVPSHTPRAHHPRRRRRRLPRPGTPTALRQGDSGRRAHGRDLPPRP